MGGIPNSFLIPTQASYVGHEITALYDLHSELYIQLSHSSALFKQVQSGQTWALLHFEREFLTNPGGAGLGVEGMVKV